MQRTSPPIAPAQTQQALNTVQVALLARTHFDGFATHETLDVATARWRLDGRVFADGDDGVWVATKLAGALWRGQSLQRGQSSGFARRERASLNVRVDIAGSQRGSCSLAGDPVLLVGIGAWAREGVCGGGAWSEIFGREGLQTRQTALCPAQFRSLVGEHVGQSRSE